MLISSWTWTSKAKPGKGLEKLMTGELRFSHKRRESCQTSLSIGSSFFRKCYLVTSLCSTTLATSIHCQQQQDLKKKKKADKKKEEYSRECHIIEKQGNKIDWTNRNKETKDKRKIFQNIPPSHFSKPSTHCTHQILFGKHFRSVCFIPK